jgi:sensor c-di-GMP phosphodiesterase-like protein
LPSQKRSGLKAIAAVLAGVFAIGVPVLLFNMWLKSQGDDEVSFTAGWAVATVDRQIGETVSLLNSLAARGVDSCQSTNLEMVRELVFASGLIKEVTLIGADNQPLCNDAGALPGRREVVGSSATSQSDIVLDVVRVTVLGDRFLRVRKVGQGGKPTLAALVPATALLPQATLQSGRPLGYARMTLADGTVVGSSGIASEAEYNESGRNVQQGRSQQYGVVVAVSMERGGVIARYEDLRRIAVVMTGLLAVLLLSFALLLTRRGRDHGNDLAKAIFTNEFVPYYQPVVDIQTGKLHSAEVLVRWRQPDGTLVMPGAFIPAMESSGLILDLTRALMRTVRQEMGEALGKRPDMMIAFNIAPAHFDDALILNDVGTIFDGSSIRLSQLILELTERCEVENLTSTRRTIAALQGLGCKVAIDDVGAGHSGLSYILKLGVDIIKIDKIFVDAIGTEAHSKAIIETMIDLARNMKMEIVAEGVENFDQVTYLREHGIQQAQGFVFAPPLPAESFLKLLEAMDPVAERPGQTVGTVARLMGKPFGAKKSKSAA